MALARILLLDDEPSLVELMRRYLSRLGYDVEACNLARQAWELIAVERRNYDLLIVDLLLPDARGDVLLEKILERDTAVRALICSGAPAPDHMFASGRVRFLQKPFLPIMLAEEVALILADSPAARA